MKALPVACVGILGLALLIMNVGRFSNYSEAVEASQRYGLDYDSLLGKAYTDDNAARGFMLLGLVMDGAASEQFSWDLYQLTKARGDSQMAQLVESLKVEHAKEIVLRELAFEGGFYSEDDPDWVEFGRTFPKLTQMIKASVKP